MGVQTVLVVDDSPAQLEHIRDIVNKAGYQVLTAASGKDAVRVAFDRKPDLIFMDIVMDDLDGYGACREILENSDTKDTPVIFVSTKNSRADQMWAQRQGAKGLIGKPYKDKQILAELKRY